MSAQWLAVYVGDVNFFKRLEEGPALRNESNVKMMGGSSINMGINNVQNNLCVSFKLNPLHII